MGHKEINIRRVIPAPPGAVFALLLDRSTWPTWSGHDTFELVRPGTAGPYEVGSVGLLRSGRRVMREEIVEVVADQRVGYTLLAGLPLGLPRRLRADPDRGGHRGRLARNLRRTARVRLDLRRGPAPLHRTAARRTQQATPRSRHHRALIRRLRAGGPPPPRGWRCCASVTALAAAAAGLVFDLAGRLPGPWGTRVAAAAGPGSTAHPPASRPRSPQSHRHLGRRAGHHGGAAAPIQHRQRAPIDDRG